MDMDEALFVLFAAWHFRRGNQASTVKRYATAVKSLMARIGKRVPLKDYSLFEAALHGFKRLRPPKDKRLRLPVTVALLKKLKKHVNFDIPLQRTLWCVMVLAVFGLLRLGELTVKTYSDTTYPRQRDFSMREMRLVLHLPQSKTDPFRLGVDVQFAASGAEICPLEVIIPLMSDWRNHDGPAFQDRGRPIHRDQVISFLRSLLSAEGIDPNQYAGHSFRKGGAQSLYDAGVPMADIKALGRWRSWCFALYLSITVESHARYSQMMGAAKESQILQFGRGFLI
jgi:hypothetical protein